MFRIRTILAGAAVAAAAVLAVAAPASAHDELISSTPAANEQLTAAPEQIVLTFSNELLELEENSGTDMTVVDESGRDWAAGAPAVEADTVTVPLEPGMAGGTYVVTWRVVSSDGHPTSGEYSFSIAADAVAPEATEAATDEPTEPAEVETAESEPAETTADATPWPLIIGLGALAVAAIVIIAVLAARRKR